MKTKMQRRRKEDSILMKKLLLDKWADFNDSVKKFEAQSSSIEKLVCLQFCRGFLGKGYQGWGVAIAR